MQSNIFKLRIEHNLLMDSTLSNYFPIMQEQYKARAQPGGKGAEAPPLAKTNLGKNITYRIVLIFLCLNDTNCVIWPIYGLKN